VAGESSLARGIAPDGRAVLVSNHIPKDYETFLVRTDPSGAVRLSAGDAAGISPDGSWAMTSSADLKTLFLSPLAMGPTRTIPNPDGMRYETLPTWLPDGRRFVVISHRGTEPSRGFVCDSGIRRGNAVRRPWRDVAVVHGAASVAGRQIRGLAGRKRLGPTMAHRRWGAPAGARRTGGRGAHVR
jgi:hypothetical protein